MSFKAPAGSNSVFSFASVFRGLLTALAAMLIGILLLGIIYYFTGITESTMPITASALLFIGVSLGGFYSSRHSRAKGLVHGLATGIAVFILIWLLMGIFLPAGVALFPLIQKLLICLVGGSLGGIFGVGF